MKTPPVVDTNIATSKLMAFFKKSGLTSTPHSLHTFGLLDTTLSHAENVVCLQFGHMPFFLEYTLK